MEPSASADTALPDSGSVPVPSGVVPPGRAGVLLGLRDFFQPSQDWSELIVNVANRSGLSAIQGEVNYCGSDPAELELRLADSFRTLKFSVGQANTSQNSDQVLLVTVTGNGRQLDAKRVPFNQVANLTESISGVNAAVLSFQLDPSVDGCGNASVQAAIFGTTVT